MPIPGIRPGPSVPTVYGSIYQQQQTTPGIIMPGAPPGMVPQGIRPPPGQALPPFGAPGMIRPPPLAPGQPQ